MSLGSPIVPIRVPEDLLMQINREVSQSLKRTTTEPWTRSSFIIKAIREKLAHCRRSRKEGRPIKKSLTDTVPPP